MKSPGLRNVALIVCTVALATSCAKKVDNAEIANGLRDTVSGTPPWVDTSALGQRLWTIEQAFYASRQHAPAWVDGDETTPHWKDLVQQLKYSEVHGLDPATYPIAELEQLREQSQTKVHGTRFPVQRIPEMDAKMTYAYLRYAADLIGWTRTPRQVHENWLTDSKDEDRSSFIDERARQAFQKRIQCLTVERERRRVTGPGELEAARHRRDPHLADRRVGAEDELRR